MFLPFMTKMSVVNLYYILLLVKVGNAWVTIPSCNMFSRFFYESYHGNVGFPALTPPYFQWRQLSNCGKISPILSQPKIISSVSLSQRDAETEILPLDFALNLQTNEKIALTPLEQVTSKMKTILRREQSSSIEEVVKGLIAVEGYVTHKRSFGSSLAFIDLVSRDRDNVVDVQKNFDNEDKNYKDTGEHLVLQALLKRQNYYHPTHCQEPLTTNSPSTFGALIKAINPGMKLSIIGEASQTRNPGEVVLLIQQVNIIGLSRDAQILKGLLSRIFITDGQEEGLNLGEIATAARVDQNSLKRALCGETVKGDIFHIADNMSKTQDKGPIFPNENASHWNMRVSYKSIAQKIIHHLPDDKCYPTKIIKSKGYVHKDNHKILLEAPSSLLSTVPEVKMQIKAQRHEKQVEAKHLKVTDFRKMKRIDFRDDKLCDTVLPLVIVVGWIQNRRRFKDSVTILEITNELESNTDSMDSNQNIDDEVDRLRCVLHPEIMNFRGKDNFLEHRKIVEQYGNLLAHGSKALFKGYYVESEDEKKGSNGNRSQLWLCQVQLLRCSWRPSVLVYFLDILANNVLRSSNKENMRRAQDVPTQIEMSEVANALNLSGGEAEAKKLALACKDMDNTERRWCASELSRKLQDSNSRIGRLTNQMVNVLDLYRSKRDVWPLEHVTIHDDIGTFDNIDLKSNCSNLSSLRSSIEGSRWQRSKRPQLQWMTKQILGVLTTHPEYGSRPLNILDVGGGKGHLANCLASTLGPNLVKIHVIDIDQRTVRNGALTSRRRSLPIRYKVGDASMGDAVADLLGSPLNDSDNMENSVTPYNSEKSNENFDIVVALHACGALSDVALGHAVRYRAGFVIVPCCFRSNSHLQVETPVFASESKQDHRKGISVSKWLGIETEHLDILQKISEIQGDIDTSSLGIHTLCALRAEAVEQRFNNGNLHKSLRNHTNLISEKNSVENSEVIVSLNTFSQEFSTRNYCLVGKFKS